MPRTIRRTLAVTAAVGVLLATGAGLAYADDGDDDGGNDGATSASQPAAPGTGNGLSGGPTHTQVLRGAPAVPLLDPTLGEGTVLPPVYNAIG
ncbi:MAG TPA: hypothetical protein VGP05_10945 [Pseudonocardia sp.]|jgi:hypothetical protein|nr:hypothetical protein [Pseudonocardia sp.]